MHRALVHLDEPYTHNAVIKALQRSKLEFDICDAIAEDNSEADLISAPNPIALQWLEYELINWSLLAAKEETTMANAYCIRKGLIRKAQFSYNVSKYLSKNPESILKQAIPETWQFELDHIDYIDEALNEVFEVERDLKENELSGTQKHVFIIKPSMANKAAGIHVFDSLKQLCAIFEEPESDDEQSDSGYDEDDDDDDDQEDLSQVREWVIQRYISNPLLVNNHKFHIRAYVLAISNIQVYIYRDMLALFALRPYDLTKLSDPLAHISNTCIQTNQADFDEDQSVRLFWELNKSGIQDQDLEGMFSQMQAILADVFDACTSEMTTLQAIPNSFELFGVDFLVDADHKVYFLETNAFPDFKQTGSKLQHVVQELFDATVQTAIEPFFGDRTPEQHPKLTKVFDKKLLSLQR
ncbi:tubulin-tyrosine ligase family-domain-containing protein [Zychaea mexicana]|uniref:tubulin-tyrosine ligase family-domain-containing protein n=1 Tax=Zychaea mexicana TaxID=64656 RepID=UPI0022FEE93A|nr:tubulin-tyrosine ligase family-domain-containing protein [Zychaea mexicana]KAI9488573.1 tubulin-tyrosine ligase family-domain-containing protein [Zychaea mexicana]